MILDINNPEKVSKDEIEIVQLKKHEYKIVASYSRSKGMRLFSYSPLKDDLLEIEVKNSSTMHCFLTPTGWVKIDFENQRVTSDPRLIYFEALNINVAKNKISKYHKTGKLFNLKQPKNDTINIFKPLKI